LLAAHLLVQPNYGNNRHVLGGTAWVSGGNMERVSSGACSVAQSRSWATFARWHGAALGRRSEAATAAICDVPPLSKDGQPNQDHYGVPSPK
jgi:hypothetical protein